MTATRGSRHAVAFALAAALALSPMAAGALGTGEPLTEDALVDLLAGDPGLVDAILAADPLPALSLLGYSDSDQRLIGFLGVDVGAPQEYGFGNDPAGQPVLDVPGTRIAAAGAVQVMFPGSPTAARGATDEHVFVEHGQGIVPGTVYTMMWAKYHDGYDLTSMDTVANRGFVTSLPDVPLWESAFAGDTWWGGYQMPALLSDASGDGLAWFMEMSRYDPEDPALFVAVEFDGFALLSGDLLVIGVRTADLLGPPPPISGLRGMPARMPDDIRIGYFSHERPYGTPRFTPGHVTTWPMVPDRGYDDFTLGCWSNVTPGIGCRYVITAGDDVLLKASTPTSTPEETTTTAAPAVTTTVAAQEPGGEGVGLPAILWVVLVVFVLAAAAFAWWRFAGSRVAGGDAEGEGPCRDEYERWQFYRRLCDEERAAVDRGEQSRMERLDELKGRLASLEPWEDSQREYLESIIPEYEQGASGRESLDVVCTRADEAHAAYEECLRRSKEAAAPKPAPPPAPASPGATSEGGGGGAPATAPPSVAAGAPPGGTRERRCVDGSVRNQRNVPGYPKSIFLVVGYDVRLVSEGTRFQSSAGEADRVGQSLEEIAEDLANLAEGKLPGTLGELQDLKASLEDAHGKMKDVAEKGAGSVARSEIGARLDGLRSEINGKLQAALEEATGVPVGEIKAAATKVPELMQNPAKIPLEILRFTADLAAKVARFSGRIIRGGDMYRLEVWVQRTQIDILWRSYEKCIDGTWRIGYELMSPAGPTTWKRERVVNDVPGPSHAGPAFARQLRRLERWCEREMGRSADQFSKEMSPPRR